MQLMVITSPVALAGEAGLINRLFDAGLGRLHLRKPGYSEQQVRELLNGIAPAYHNRMALHQHHQLAEAYGISRLHYTEPARRQTPEQEWTAQQAKGFRLSSSLHTVAALDGMDRFEYVFLGPVFDSLSKPGYEGRFSPAFRLQQPRPAPAVIALGGITAATIATVAAMGFEGAAVLGAIWNRPEQALRQFEQLQNRILNR